MPAGSDRTTVVLIALAAAPPALVAWSALRVLLGVPALAITDTGALLV